MTRLITHTNLIVDDFDFCKSFPPESFVHFLTHFHSDHYEGLSPLWNYSPVHCTHQTAKFILNKYPKLKRVHPHHYNQPFRIQLPPGQVEITFLDAKHIPGSAMILFKGYMGTILFTGDFRYDYRMVQQNPTLFPPHLRKDYPKQSSVEAATGISLGVDEMIFDNTYCNQMFKFGKEDEIATRIIQIIEANRHKKLVYIAMGALGKHRILMKICDYFQTLVAVTKKQFEKISVAGLRTDFLTLDYKQAFIQLISKKNRAQIIEATKKSQMGDNFICIDTDFIMLDHQAPDGINFIVPYSLHSSYPEMETFVRMVRPCILRKVVDTFVKFNKKVKYSIRIDHPLKFARYLDYYEFKLPTSKSGFSHLVRNYTDLTLLSERFLKWFTPECKTQLLTDFGLGNGEQNLSLRKRMPKIDEQSEFRPTQKKASLQQIANKLNAVNKNLTLEKSFANHQSEQYQNLFQNIFEEELNSNRTTSNSHCTQTYGLSDKSDSAEEQTRGYL